ncbi:MAG: glycosyltransferase family 2 protein [Candidatus Zixiibacteriota bacterium]|nr:MAG: glycosyltransferase family 2 protein [candidate division Zixibacteria bacterium]
MSQVSAVIIARDEEKNIRRCLESVSWTDEIILVDSGSQDRTLEIAGEYGVKSFHRPWNGYGTAKKEAVRRASGEWILSVDADEEVPPALRDEIKEITASDGSRHGYYISRKTMFLGRWIKHCGWYPDYVLRLFRRSYGDFNDAVVHEKVILDGEPGRLKNELLHYSYPTLEDYFRKFSWYTTLGADEAARKGVRAGWFDIAVKPALSFLSHYIVRQGFRDGIEGFMVSVLSSIAVMVKYAKVREINRNDQTTREKYVERN